MQMTGMCPGYGLGLGMAPAGNQSSPATLDKIEASLRLTLQMLDILGSYGTTKLTNEDIRSVCVASLTAAQRTL